MTTGLLAHSYVRQRNVPVAVALQLTQIWKYHVPNTNSTYNLYSPDSKEVSGGRGFLPPVFPDTEGSGFLRARAQMSKERLLPCRRREGWSLLRACAHCRKMLFPARTGGGEK